MFPVIIGATLALGDPPAVVWWAHPASGSATGRGCFAADGRPIPQTVTPLAHHGGVLRSLDDTRHVATPGTCALSAWSGDPARCRWCDGPARPGTPWCGHLCEDDYRRNHWWDQARQAAVVRDGACCVRCGLGPDAPTVAKLLLRALVPMSTVQAARLWRSPEFRALQAASQIEVNHIVPRRGDGYHAGCHHHLHGLETLCHPCHVAETNAQQAAHRAERQAG